MSDIAIRAQDLSKRYKMGQNAPSYRTLRDTLCGAGRAALTRVRRSRDERERTFWALSNVSFEINNGEAIGIIGRNGAGKSTLLKILSRITEPSSGWAEIRGRVGSLLEVGTGFHPELTGRENVYLNGAILGMKRAEIGRRFDEIVSFAETEKFIDTPVKHYSSGMHMRLAFAVAAHLDTEILLVDEVLAVGDASFQRKCMSKMGEAAHRGRTILFVSHNTTAVKSLCDRAIWLADGHVQRAGRAGEIADAYLAEASAVRTESVWHDPATAPGSEAVRLRHARLTANELPNPEFITVRDRLRMEFAYWNYDSGAQLEVSLIVENADRVCVFNVASEPQNFAVGLITQSCEIPGDFLNDGRYTVTCLIVRDNSRVLLNLPDALCFDVLDVPRTGSWMGKWMGVVRPTLPWTTHLQHECGEVTHVR